MVGTDPLTPGSRRRRSIETASEVSTSSCWSNGRRRRPSEEKEESIEDPLGDCLTTLFNQHAAFSYSKQSNDDDNDIFWYSPLISRHNLRVLRRKCSQEGFWRTLPQNLFRMLILQHCPSLQTSLKVSAAITVVFLIVAAIITHIVIVFSVRIILFVAFSGLCLLVDWDDVKQTCKPLAVFWTLAYRILKWMDAHILQGHRFAGREWNAHDFCWDPETPASSREKTLLELPPPSVKQGRRLSLDRNYMARPEWSKRTVQHVVAIDFCYVMLREEQLRKQATKRARKMFKEESSFAIVEEKLDLRVTPPVRQRSNSDSAFDYLDEASAETASKSREKGRNRLVISATTNVGHPNLPNLSSTPSEAIELRMSSPRPGLPLRSHSEGSLCPDGSTVDDRDIRSDVSFVSNASDVAADLPWLDVGAKIGLRLLNSAHVQKAMTSQETTERIIGIGKQVENKFASSRRGSSVSVDESAVAMSDTVVPYGEGWKTPIREPQSDTGTSLAKPIHSMWTSPAAAASSPTFSASSISDDDDDDDDDAPLTPPLRMRPIAPSTDLSRPPLSPRASGPRSFTRRRSYGDETPRRAFRKTLMGGRPSPGRTKSSSQLTPIISDELVFPPPDLRRTVATDCTAFSPSSGRSSEARLSSVTGASSVASKAVVQKLAVDVSGERSYHHDISGEKSYHRLPLQPGTKVAVPLFPSHPSMKGRSRKINHLQFQMGTVASSKRIYLDPLGERSDHGHSDTNCLSVTAILDKSFLRNGEFAKLTFRVMDTWSPRYMPKHSKVPIGSCVATSFGIGVLVGWRVEDDCHVVRSLWQKRGAGTAHAYLNRKAIHGTIEAGVGFRVETRSGWGIVLAYVDGGSTFESGRFLVAIKEGLQTGHVLELDRKDVLACHGAQFIPVIEHIREAAHYQIQVDNYNAALREQALQKEEKTPDEKLWEAWSECLGILWQSFLKAVEEDKDFDEGVNEFMTSIIDFLERLDEKPSADEAKNSDSKAGEKIADSLISSDFEVECVADSKGEVREESKEQEPGFWIMNDIFGGVFKTKIDESATAEVEVVAAGNGNGKPSYYDRAFALLRTLMNTCSIARAASVDHHHFRLALASLYEFLLFLRTIVKVQQKNTSAQSLNIWKHALEEIGSTFGPIKERLMKIGQGVAQRMQKQGRKAKVRVLKFVDTVLGDERLLFAMEQGDWDQCLARFELALVKAHIIEEENLVYYRKTGKFIYDQMRSAMSNEGSAAARNNEKLALLAQAVQWIASPRRSVLKIFRRDDVLQLFERILIRVFQSEETASRMLTIHAANFYSLRHLRMLKDLSTSGRLWIPLLNAADEEFSWMASQMPENTKEFMCPLSSLFSLCVAQFHKIYAGDSSRDWLDFLLEEDGARIIDDIDMKLIAALGSFSRDVKETMVVLPYYASIDEDILNLLDEVDLDMFLKEASEALDDPEKLSQFVREKVTIAIERFLNYLPKMSIPVEKRDLGDGWGLTCHGEDGGDLTLSDVRIKRENLICQIMGGDALFFPMFADDDTEVASVSGSSVASVPAQASSGDTEESVLDHIRELILHAQSHGCWKAGVGGVGQPPSDRYIASVLHGLPVSSVLNCAIELWRNLEIDDDELLEIAIRDVSFQIKLQKDREERSDLLVNADFDEEEVDPPAKEISAALPRLKSSNSCSTLNEPPSFESIRQRFNPRADPTVLYVEMKKLTLQLDKFLFRIEKIRGRTLFDPVFEGRGMLSVQNVSIKLRIQCAKERVKRSGLGVDVSAPTLLIRELEVELERVKLQVKNTGSDWLLNKAVSAFEENISNIVEENLRDQVLQQAKQIIENLNSHFLANPDTLLNILGISMEDLDENVVWV